ncbi:D-aminoacyl-tRNA deacylase [Lentilactobacillus parabuchneri]|uniref:D-aminoacyl-tRNA deacylase n=1 Tax=Lentilactobacillus parabuchneri TaxID=152331 RepID=UPI000A10F773|nr:D-tyrosyl-tRNA(Tyr) deacylase [Lentilactobacillus parabuchneri]
MRVVLQRVKQASVSIDGQIHGQIKKGFVPSFTGAGEPQHADKVYEQLNARLRQEGLDVQTGVFGADMLVDISNDGPVTIIFDTDHK